MTAPAPSRRHWLRWIGVAIVLVLAALAAAVAIYVHSLLQPQRFTALLEGDLAAVGLKLKLEAPAEPMLFPHPGVRLQGFSLANTGSDVPLLTANAATIVVPWRALLHGEVAIERVDIDAPRIDLGELKALLARLPHHAGPPRLPTIATGVQIRSGTLANHGQPLLFGLGVDTGELVPGQPFRMHASARDRSGRTFEASLVTVASPVEDGVISFTPIHLELAETGGASLDLQGHGRWRGGEDFNLQMAGSFEHPALAPASAGSSPPAGATSVAPVDGTTTDHVELRLAPRRQGTPMTVALKLDGPDAQVDASLQPTEFGGWLHQLLQGKPGEAPIPMPVTGTARIQRLDLGRVQASGIEIEAGPQLAPPGSVAPPPAASAAAAAH